MNDTVKLRTGVIKAKAKGSLKIDATLTKEGQAADAKSVGDKVTELKGKIETTKSELKGEIETTKSELKKDYRIVDGETEWINPPMEINKEYKLTERFMGKPVYTKLYRIEYNQDDYAFNYASEEPDIDKVLEYSGHIALERETGNNGEKFIVVNPLPSMYVSFFVSFQGAYDDNGEYTTKRLFISMHIDTSSGVALDGDTCYVWIKYTKA